MVEHRQSDMEERRRRTRLIIAAVGGLVAVLTAVQVLIQELRFPSPIPSNILIFALESLQELELATVQIFDRRGSERVRVRGGEPLEDDDAFPAGSLAVQAALGGQEQSLITQTWMGGLVRGIVPIIVASEKGEVIGAAAVGYPIPGGMAQKASDIATGIAESDHRPHPGARPGNAGGGVWTPRLSRAGGGR